MNTVFVYDACPPCSECNVEPAYPDGLCAGCAGRQAAREIVAAVFSTVFCLDPAPVDSGQSHDATASVREVKTAP